MEVDIPGNDMALCKYAEEVTLRPQNIEEVDPISTFKKNGDQRRSYPECNSGSGLF